MVGAVKCSCGRHFFHHATQAWCVMTGSGVVVLKPHAWPECVRSEDEARIARSEESTRPDLGAVK